MKKTVNLLYPGICSTRVAEDRNIHSGGVREGERGKMEGQGEGRRRDVFVYTRTWFTGRNSA